MSVEKTLFGITKEGEKVYKYTVENKNGMKAVVSEYGAVLVSLFVPDKKGELTDVVLGFDKLESYFDNTPGFGSTIGRHANRIGGASFELNEVTYKLDKNEGNNNLHGGFNGYNKRVWKSEVEENDLGQAVKFTYKSKDSDQGFPGNLDVSVTYTLTEDNSLMLSYNAVADKDTIVNLTNHSYFNLSGHDSGLATDQKVWIDSDYFTRTDSESIPTGEIASVKGTPMDFNTLTTVSDRIDADFNDLKLAGGYDHNWVLKNNGENALVARLVDEKSQREMEVYTDLPGMQFYSANFLDGTEIGKGGVKYVKRSGLCFETQYFPDSIHHANFKQAILKAGETYNTVTVYKFI